MTFLYALATGLALFFAVGLMVVLMVTIVGHMPHISGVVTF